jgi:TRAP transporter TAXI family solute receptor
MKRGGKGLIAVPAAVIRSLARVFVMACLLAAPASAQGTPDMVFFRIGTGGTAGTYFPIGGLIANGISNPPGSRSCNEGGACGVPGLVAIAIAANGSVANVSDIQTGRIEAGLMQSDIAYRAFTGGGMFEDREPVTSLRAIANLYPETVQIVARKGAGIASVSDMRGKRISLDEPGSGTLANALMVLEAFGLRERDIKPEYLKPNVAGAKLKAGELDAFFFVGGAPVDAISELADTTDISFVPISGAQAEQALTRYSFYSWDQIPAGTYRGQDSAVQTVSVGSLFVTSAEQSEDVIHGVTAALWNANTRRLLDRGHATGRLIRKENALRSLSIPLHPGAERYYREAGMLPAN